MKAPALLVADGHEAHRAVLERRVEVERLLPGDPEHVLDPLGLQAADEQLGGDTGSLAKATQLGSVDGDDRAPSRPITGARRPTSPPRSATASSPPARSSSRTSRRSSAATTASTPSSPTRFEQARAEADAADARVAEAADPAELPPLLGVPCTIKESFAVAGLPNSAGLDHRKDLRAPANSTAVQRLVDAGAIPLGVTNVSELTLWIESTNRVYGRTNNAYDRRRTAGGSSGGEGAAIGSGFAPFGIGTDFGGSIRIPAFFNGVFGHKPTGSLVPHTGHFPAPKDEVGSRLLGIGPLARRAEDLWPVTRALAGPDGIDETVAELELGDPAEVSIEGLQVTITDDATLLPVSAELRNARIRAARALAERGARVRRVSLPRPARRDPALPRRGPPGGQPDRAARGGGI